MKISIIGTGYAGLVTGTCLADFGLSVIYIDQDEQKINILNSGGVPIYEPNLAPLIEKNISAERLTFTTNLENAVRKSKVIFIAVGTPSNNDGTANLAHIEKVAQQIATHLQEVISANKRQRELMVEKIKHLLGDLKDKIIDVLGLAFKQNTDDIRESPSVDIIKLLLKEGTQIRCFDPLAMENTRKILSTLTYCQDEYEIAQGSDVLVIATEWNQFRNLDLIKVKKLLKSPILLDLRNLYNPASLKSLGFIYEGVGRR